MSEGRVSDMFARITDDIFAQAGVDKSCCPELWNESRDILQTLMGQLSVTMGLSYKRVAVFEEQKQAIVDDLVRMKANGEL